jgi:hypothetical protein
MTQKTWTIRDVKATQAWLATMLPTNYDALFTVTTAGRYAGLVIACPTCDEKPPAKLKYGSRKWRWLAVHIETAHAAKRRRARRTKTRKRAAARKTARRLAA